LLLIVVKMPDTIMSASISSNLADSAPSPDFIPSGAHDVVSSSPPKPTLLLDLPQELIDAIFDNIAADRPSKTSRQTLHALCLTNKSFFHQARPLLYGFVHLDRPHKSYITSTRLLARTLCAAPELGLLIRNIFSSPPVVEYIGMPKYVRRFYNKTQQEQKLLRFKDVLMAGLYDKDEVAKSIPDCEAIAQGEDLLEVLVVLMMATQVRSITLQTGYRAWKHAWDASGEPRHALCLLWSKANLQHLPAGAFANLEELTINGLVRKKTYDYPGENFMPQSSSEVLSGVMGLPSLRTLKASGLVAGWEPLEWSFDNASSSIQRLSLIQSRLTPEMLVAVVETCAVLESFRYDLHCLNFGRRWEDSIPVGIRAMEGALFRHRDSLNDLTITNRGNRGGLWRKDNSTISTTAFHRLAALEIDMLLLVGCGTQIPLIEAVQGLPLSLRSLTIHTYERDAGLLQFVLQVGALQARGLERMTVTSTEWPTSRLIKVFRRGRAMSSKERHGVNYESPVDGRGPRVTFMCWELQKWLPSEIEKLVVDVQGAGIEGLVSAQLRDVWDDDIVLGEALLSSFAE
jgi:hypothetical protein